MLIIIPEVLDFVGDLNVKVKPEGGFFSSTARCKKVKALYMGMPKNNSMASRAEKADTANEVLDLP